MRQQGVGRNQLIFLYQWHDDGTDFIGDACVLVVATQTLLV
jgi:hypothetical protein